LNPTDFAKNAKQLYPATHPLIFILQFFVKKFISEKLASSERQPQLTMQYILCNMNFWQNTRCLKLSPMTNIPRLLQMR